MNTCSFQFELLVSSLHTILQKLLKEGGVCIYVVNMNATLKLLSLAVKLFHLA